MTKKIELTREELYEKVWTAPASKVSKELGISDVGLAKICKRLNIPKPGLGYWARLAHGQKVPKVPLPSAANASSRPVEFIIHEKVVDPVPDDLAEFRKIELERVRGVSALVSTKETKRIQQSLFGGKTQKTPERYPPWIGWILMPRHWSPRISVAQENWNRAAEMLARIVASAELCGYKLGRDENGMDVLMVHEARLEMAIRETAKQVPYVPPPQLRKGEYQPVGEPKIRYMPGGKLRLTVMDTRYPILKRIWIDSDKGKIEDLVPSILEACVEIAVEKRVILMRERAAEEERRRQEKERELREAKEREAQLIFKRIWTDVEAWEKSIRLREYLKARIESERERTKEAGFSEGFTSWIEWTERLVQRTDPLTKPINDDWMTELLPRLYPW